MDHEAENAHSESEERLSKIFLDFMARLVHFKGLNNLGELFCRMTKFEELTDAGNQLLVRFHQEIGYFGRPQIRMMSNMASDIIDANCTNRVKAYVEAGCTNSHRNIHSILNLHSSQKGLEDHLEKVRSLIHELECLVEDAIVITRTAIQSTPLLLEESLDAPERYLVLLEKEMEQLHSQHRSTSLVISMSAIYHMLNLDYTMQEKIVGCLNLTTAPSELETYSLMWNLHPYVSENVINMAWKYVQ